MKRKAEDADHSAETDEARALRYSLGEGLLEIGLVLTSLYSIARCNMFLTLGVIAGVLGAAVAIAGLFA